MKRFFDEWPEDDGDRLDPYADIDALDDGFEFYDDDIPGMLQASGYIWEKMK